jgi:oxygen-independent coproporphyrinogen-3 oxidase
LFGDYLGIGAGAHGKISFADGRIHRYSKRRQPQDYMAAVSGNFVGSSRTVARSDIVGEFMMNALRLNDGFTLPQFGVRTGLHPESFAPQLQSLCERELLIRDGDVVKTSELGRRFLDDVVGAFFG